MTSGWTGPLEKIDDYRWLIPRSYKSGMRTDGLIFAQEKMLAKIKQDMAPEQVANVAFLPGIVGYSMAMPDIHWGYGFPIGGVAAFDVREGVISPGGVGYDINCGVRLLRTNLTLAEIKPYLPSLLDEIFRNVPSGVGSEGKLRLSNEELRQVMLQGARWAVKKGFGWERDLDHTEENGEMEGADPQKVSQRAMERGRSQLGTLGSGNHFLEIQVVAEIYDAKTAKVMGIEKEGQITVMIHTGSRGFGHQICDEYVKELLRSSQHYNIYLPDKQLACAPFSSPEGKAYFSAMVCAANYAWANRQCITHWVREAFEKVFKKSAEELGLELVYDVAHNIAKVEEHIYQGKKVKVVVHRKGATRAFAPGHPLVPKDYREIGQPVIVPGDMGRASYLLVGTQRAMEETFGSTCHGAGRLMSRAQASRSVRGQEVKRRMEEQGILVRAASFATLTEEIPEAYKDVGEVVDTCDGAGISRKVAKLRPLAVIKG
ncbi:MAG: RtcB family protein [bacterium]